VSTAIGGNADIPAAILVPLWRINRCDGDSRLRFAAKKVCGRE